MRDEDKKIIREKISPKVNSAEISLLLGAGFSINNEANGEKLPGGEDLKQKILQKCNRTGGSKTTLKDAYQFAKRSLPEFDKFIMQCFTASSVFSWQQNIFKYAWARIYTTNIDNVLDLSLDATEKIGKTAGDFKFFNYCDEGLISETLGVIPIVTIHGTCKKLSEGFIFSTLEYAKAASKILDWHNDLAAKIIAGGIVVIGNQLDESDLDTYISRRQATYDDTILPENWIVLPSPDEIKAENWRSAGFYVIDATAEEFFTELFSVCKPRTVGEIILETVPAVKKVASNIKAMTWFKGAFKLIFNEIENAKMQKGILRHFITGADPDWFFIVNKAHAETSRSKTLLDTAATMLQSNTNGVGLLHIIGPSGSGKTTAIKSALSILVRTYRFSYEFNENQSIDKELLRNIIFGLSEKSVFIFYSAADYYFAIKEIADRHKDRQTPYCLFILEDRTNEHKKNKRQLSTSGIIPNYIEFGALTIEDAKNISLKIEEAGLIFPKFSEKSLDARAHILLDKEKGYGGDLLSALFSLTTHENFEAKVYQDYQSAGDGLARSVLDLVAVLHSLNYSTPIDYIAGALQERTDEIVRCTSDDLAGILVIPINTNVLKCRHRIIANYYFENYISGRGTVEMLIGLLEFLSRQFTIEDIKHHPLPFRIYRDVVSFEFVYDRYFPKSTRDNDTEKLYHEAQRFFGRDGIFWLHFGRYYRKIGNLPAAIDCFRSGLDFYDSFQTRHSLGTALLELYLETGDESNYDDGSMILNRERISRGSGDPYPTSTLLRLLTRVIQKNPSHLNARALSKECFNMGFKHFNDEDHFKEAASEYLRLTTQ